MKMEEKEIKSSNEWVEKAGGWEGGGGEWKFF